MFHPYFAQKCGKGFSEILSDELRQVLWSQKKSIGQAGQRKRLTIVGFQKIVKLLGPGFCCGGSGVMGESLTELFEEF